MPRQTQSRPRPRRFTTKVLHVAQGDWPLVKRGLKTEYRHRIKDTRRRRYLHDTPSPVVLSPTKGHDFALAVLEATWFEPLGAISPESLQREGFESFAEFRRYWVLQREFNKRRFKAEDPAVVFRVRLATTDEDFTYCGRLLLARLYAPWLPGLREEVDVEYDEEAEEPGEDGVVAL